MHCHSVLYVLFPVNKMSMLADWSVMMVEARSLKASGLGDMTTDREWIQLGESVREEALWDVVSPIKWHVIRSAVPVG